MTAMMRACTIVFVLMCLAAPASAEDRFDAQKAARDILDDAAEGDRREQLVAASVPHAAQVVRAMTKDMPDSQEEEYRRIPWIWRVSIAAGKQNDDQVLRQLLNVSLPEAEKSLADWQAVVIGGGVINGISQLGECPAARIDELLGQGKDKEQYWPRWERTIELAAEMVENEKVPTGTRYDALRILGATSWKAHGELITKYLADANEELQMGAVSAAGDFEEDQAAKTLLEKLPVLSENNRAMAIEALMHPARHLDLLREAVREGRVRAEWLTSEQKVKLQ